MKVGRTSARRSETEVFDDSTTIDCAELILAKFRSGGKTGITRVAFYPPYTQFANWPEGVEMPEPREPKKPGKN